jgi:hypothetical protein
LLGLGAVVAVVTDPALVPGVAVTLVLVASALRVAVEPPVDAARSVRSAPVVAGDPDVPGTGNSATCGPGIRADGTIGAPSSAPTTSAAQTPSATAPITTDRRITRRRRPLASTNTGRSAGTWGDDVSVIPLSTSAASPYRVNRPEDTTMENPDPPENPSRS